ncbi:MAG: GLUG motif-containing protein [Bacteriovoracaceae bacterium]
MNELKEKLRHILLILGVVLLSSCVGMDQSGVQIEEECSEECLAAIELKEGKTLCEQNADADEYDDILGQGTPENPYIICTAPQLFSIASELTALSKSYRLASDIDMNPYYLAGNPEFQIGSCGQTSCTLFGSGHEQFLGDFDGAGFVIFNFSYQNAGMNGASFFGSVGPSGSVRNLTFENLRVAGNSSVGGVAGRNDGALSNIKVRSGLVTTLNNGASSIGGIVGTNYGSLIDSSVEDGSLSLVSITSYTSSYTGGLVGTNTRTGRVQNSTNTASVRQIRSGSVGGLIGLNQGVMTSSWNSGEVSGNGESIGGLVGVMDHQGKISKSYNSGPVEGQTGSTKVGGLVGHISFPSYNDQSKSEDESRGIVIDSYNVSAVSAPDGEMVGGLIGHNQGEVVTSYNSGNVSSDQKVGGLVGVNDFMISQSFAHGFIISANGSYGNIVGLTPAADLANGVNPTPSWDGDDEDYAEVKSPFNTYYAVTCAGCNNFAGIEVASHTLHQSPASFRLYTEPYVYNCPSNASNCPTETQYITHWDFGFVWKTVPGSLPVFR